MSLNGKLHGKIVLVTGASSGLGERFAKVLAADGARVVLAARRLELLEAVRDEIISGGGQADAVAMDLADCNSIACAIEFIATSIGQIDVLINNGGTANLGKIVDVTPEDYAFVMDINVRGSFFVAKEVAKRMIECSKTDAHRQFRVINIASVCGMRAVEMPSVAVYGVSKAAVIHMTKYMSSEWRDYNITVNAISPGYIETPGNEMYFATNDGKKLLEKLPRKRLGKREDLDLVITLLASDEAKFINGTNITIDDGLMAL